MPAPRTDIDREAVAASVALKGIRATVRDTGVPLGTVQRIAKAANVAAPETFTETIKRPITSVRSIQVDTPRQMRPAHAIITEEMARNGADARLSASIYAKHTLSYAADMARNEPETALAAAGDVKAVVGAAQGANVPGFERQVEQSAGAVVSIALLGMDLSALEVPVRTMLPDSGDPCAVQDQY